jgi:serine protease Do
MMKPKKHWLMQKSSTGAVVLLSVALGASLAGQWDRPAAVIATDQAQVQTEHHAALSQIQDAFTSLAERVEPTVVSIEATRTVTPAASEGQLPEGLEGSPFERFFRQYGQPMPRGRQRSGGSGVIVRERDNTVYVLTNQHVVDGANRLNVSMSDGGKYPAKLVGADPKSDLAVLQFSPGRRLGERYVATLGDSDRVRVGQWAIAVGSPLGYDSTLTTGVISAKGRELEGVQGYKDYRNLIQTDASINPGNSGGPLVNIDGEVVGINVAIASPTGSSIGIGFAIPVNRAKTVVEQLITTGKVARGYLGVATSRANAELSDELKAMYGVKGGALVEGVSPGTPAERAGLKSEDVIVSFDGRPVNSYGDLEEAVQSTPPGKQVKVQIVRARQPQTLSLTLAERPDEAQLAARPRPGAPSEEPTPAALNDFGFAVSAGPNGGLVIARVQPDSAAEEAGLAPGDIVEAVGGSPVNDLNGWNRALANARSSLVLKLKRATTGQTAIVVVRKQ